MVIPLVNTGNYIFRACHALNCEKIFTSNYIAKMVFEFLDSLPDPAYWFHLTGREGVGSLTRPSITDKFSQCCFATKVSWWHYRYMVV